MPDDQESVNFEVGCDDAGTEWRVSVKCKTGLSEEEFAAALQSLATDIVNGDVSFKTAPDVLPKAVDPDLH